MEYFKIEHFERERPGETFPRFELVGPDKLENIRKKLAHLVGFDETVEPLKLINVLLAKSVPTGNFDITSEILTL